MFASFFRQIVPTSLICTPGYFRALLLLREGKIAKSLFGPAKLHKILLRAREGFVLFVLEYVLSNLLAHDSSLVGRCHEVWGITSASPLLSGRKQRNISDFCTNNLLLRYRIIFRNKWQAAAGTQLICS